MTDPYFGGGGSSKDPYFGGGKSKKSSKHSGVAQLGINLFHDVEDSARGLPTGLKEAVTHPGRVAHTIAHTYADTYGHGFGHFMHELGAHPLGPIMDAVTVATLPFGIGEGLAGSRAASILGRESAIVRGSEKLGSVYSKRTLKGPATAATEGRMRQISNKGFAVPGDDVLELPRVGLLPRRAAGHATDAALNRLRPDYPLVGENARWTRAVNRTKNKDARAAALRSQEFAAIARKLEPHEAAAWFMHATGDSPDRWINTLRNVAEKRLTPADRAKMVQHGDELDKYVPGEVSDKIKLLESDKFKHEFAKPGPKTQYALRAGRKLSELLTTHRINDQVIGHAREVKEIEARARGRLEALDSTAKNYSAKSNKIKEDRTAQLAQADKDLEEWKTRFAERPYLHARLSSGAEFAPQISGEIRKWRTQIETLSKRADEIQKGEGTVESRLSQAKSATSKDFPDKHDLIDVLTRLANAKDRLSKAEKGYATRHGLKPEDVAGMKWQRTRELQGGASIDAIKADLQAQGREQPYYVPDTRADDISKVEASDFNHVGGKGPTAVDKALHQNEGYLYLTGKLALDPKALAAGWRGYARRALHKAIHDELVNASIEIVRNPDGTYTLPKGYVWIRQYASQRLPKHFQVAEGKLAEGGDLTIDDLIVRRHQKGGETNLAVPENVVEDLAGEFNRSNKFVNMLFTKPTTVWRAIVLNLRLGFLVNNVVGNMFLVHFHYFGPSMIQAWASYIREQKPRMWPAFQALINREGLAGMKTAVGEREFRTMMKEQTPALYSGTMFRTQSPGANAAEGSLGGNVTEAFQAVGRGIGPLQARLAEDIPREIGLRTSIIREAKRKGIAVPKDTKAFNELGSKLLEDPHFSVKAVTEANRALGEYLTMNNFERSVLRQLVPFYGWLRAITRISFNAAIDTPGRINLFRNLGQVGAEIIREKYGNGKDVPGWLLDIVDIGKIRGEQKVLGTRGINPVSSVADVALAIGGLIALKPGETGKALAGQWNPFLSGIMDNLSGANPVTGREAEKLPWLPHMGLLGDMIQGNIVELPPTRIALAAMGHGRETTTYGQDTGLRALGAWAGVPIKPAPGHHKKAKKTSKDPYFG